MDLRKERTLKLLSDALVGKLHEKPYDDITVGEVCDAAMVRRATFYRHFSGKDDLLAYVVQRVRSDWLRRKAMPEAAPPAQVAESLTDEVVTLIAKHEDILRRHQLSPGFASVVLVIADEVALELAPAIEAHLEREGREPESAQLESQVTARFYATGLASALRWWLVEQPDMPAGEFATLFSRISSRVLE